MITAVRVEGVALLKIIQHCTTNLPHLVTGQILGFDKPDGSLEVTYSFPFARGDDDEDPDTTVYQMDMMRCLRQANYESNTVGWYTSTLLGRIWNDKNIASQFNYQDTLKGKCVLLVYDPAKSQRGSLALSAYRLTDSFMELYRNERFTLEALQAAGVTSSDIYEEVPITLHNCLLGSALLSELECRPDMRCDSERLVFGSHPYLEKNMEALMAGVDELEVEAKKISFYNRSVAKNQNYIAVQLHRRRQENAHRRANGQAELPEDDILANARSAPEPSRLEGLIATSQVGAHCNLLNQFAGESFARLFLAGKFLGQQ